MTPVVFRRPSGGRRSTLDNRSRGVNGAQGRTQGNPACQDWWWWMSRVKRGPRFVVAGCKVTNQERRLLFLSEYARGCWLAARSLGLRVPYVIVTSRAALGSIPGFIRCWTYYIHPFCIWYYVCISNGNALISFHRADMSRWSMSIWLVDNTCVLPALRSYVITELSIAQVGWISLDLSWHVGVGIAASFGWQSHWSLFLPLGMHFGPDICPTPKVAKDNSSILCINPALIPSKSFRQVAPAKEFLGLSAWSRVINVHNKRHEAVKTSRFVKRFWYSRETLYFDQ